MVVSLHAGDVRRAVGARNRGCGSWRGKWRPDRGGDIQGTVGAASQPGGGAVIGPRAFACRVRALTGNTEPYVETVRGLLPPAATAACRLAAVTRTGIPAGCAEQE